MVVGNGDGEESPAEIVAGEATPWRLFTVGQQPGDLLERNYLVLNLNAPCALTDTSWIKPGKIMRSGILTTANGEAIVDLGKQTGH